MIHARPEIKFRSCAEWPADVFTAFDGSHVSTDEHFSKAAARAICRLLKQHGFSGNGRPPVRVWVEMLNDNGCWVEVE
jgi:hypothetical protein